MSQHAKLFSASGSSRWMECTASPFATLGIDDTTSSPAAEGTVAHELAERCHKEDKLPVDFLNQRWTVIKFKDVDSGKTYDEVVYLPIDAYLELQPKVENTAQVVSHYEFEIDSEMVRHIEGYLERNDACVTPDSDVFCEQRVDYSPWTVDGDGFGTNDFGVVSSEGIIIRDLKYGQGVKVFAAENTQGMLYALGFYNQFDWLYDLDDSTRVEIHIDQPRLNHLDVWVTTVGYLKLFGDRVKLIADKILAGQGEFVPGEKQCGFCKLQPTCKALYDHNLKIVSDQFDIVYDVDTKDVATLTDDQIALILPNISLIKKWANSVEAHALKKLQEAPDSVPMYKLVRGPGRRKWVDTESALAALKKTKFKLDEVAPRSVISPSQAEKLLGKKSKLIWVDNGLVVKSLGKITLVEEKDPRPSINQDVADQFDTVED